MIISAAIVLLTLGLWLHVLWRLKHGVPRVRTKGQITRYREWLDIWCQAGEQDCDSQVKDRHNRQGGGQGFVFSLGGLPAAPSSRLHLHARAQRNYSWM